MTAPAVAFIGADGAGKSTVTAAVADRMGTAAVRIYMGVNLEEANVALPTTRLILGLKRRRGNRPDLSGWPGAGGSSRHRARDVIRVMNLIAEEWYRAAITAYHKRRGRVVIMDRHFLADYWHHDVAPPDAASRPWIGRLHGHLLRRWYPRPEHVIFLDAPPELLHRRKPETSLEHLRIRRDEYVDFAQAMGSLTTVSAEQPQEEVIRQCLEVVRKTVESSRVGRSESEWA